MERKERQPTNKEKTRKVKMFAEFNTPAVSPLVLSYSSTQQEPCQSKSHNHLSDPSNQVHLSTYVYMSHKGMALPKLIRKTQVRFSAKDDLNLLKEVLAEIPYMDKTKWEVVAQNVKENVNKVFNVTSRRVRERTQLLLQQFQKENYEALKR
ncbi:unnamed protein product [Mytilus edulis]|uniref:Uncharacterized protein n=1 Tax=Mytilus edulis TaxID=6550 RepID=A0A8S3PVS1_MYTED|nr:unnamed protein product [Mytilus edulis]